MGKFASRACAGVTKNRQEKSAGKQYIKKKKKKRNSHSAMEDADRPGEGDAGTSDVPVQHQEVDAEQSATAVALQPAAAAQPPPKPFDIFEFVKNIKCPPRQKDVISEFDEAAASNPHQILRGIFTFLRTEGVSEGDKVLVLNLAHELLFAYFDEHVDPLGEAEQQMALDALKLVYVDEATSVSVRRELNNVVSLIWKLSEEIDIEQSPNQVANLGQLLRYCLNPATHTAASTQADRHLLAELGLTLFSRIMHEIVRTPSPSFSCAHSPGLVGGALLLSHTNRVGGGGMRWSCSCCRICCHTRKGKTMKTDPLTTWKKRFSLICPAPSPTPQPLSLYVVPSSYAHRLSSVAPSCAWLAGSGP
jgi:hypothetical protein